MKAATEIKIEWKRTDSLRPYKRNSRTHSATQIEDIAKSIQAYGFNDPIALWKDGMIIAGHGRLEAAEYLKLETVPTISLEHLTEAEAKAYLIAHNALSDQAGWNQELLRQEVKELSMAGMDVSLLGLSQAEIKAMLAPDVVKDGLTDDDEVPPSRPEEITSRPGDIWQLGRHRLVCGDSTGSKPLADALDGAEADMIWTDPPYNVNVQGGTKDNLTIANDDMGEDEFRLFLTGAFAAMYANAKPGCVFYVAHGEITAPVFMTACTGAGFDHKQTIVWVKNAAVLSRQDYNWRHEPILVGWKPGAGHYFCNDFTLTTVIENIPPEPEKLSKDTLVAIVKALQENSAETVLHYKKPARNSEHPTMKPVELVQQLIENSSRAGEIILDPFGGSGTTLIAAEKSARIAALVELDPIYCDVIIRRWQNFTGAQAMLGEQSFNEIAIERIKAAA